VFGTGGQPGLAADICRSRAAADRACGWERRGAGKGAGGGGDGLEFCFRRGSVMF
jgi:hypothetical protein